MLARTEDGTAAGGFTVAKLVGVGDLDERGPHLVGRDGREDLAEELFGIGRDGEAAVLGEDVQQRPPEPRHVGGHGSPASKRRDAASEPRCLYVAVAHVCAVSRLRRRRC